MGLLLSIHNPTLRPHPNQEPPSTHSKHVCPTPLSCSTFSIPRQVFYVLNTAPKGWDGGVGFITEAMIK